MTVRAISLGGGVQSSALVVLAGLGLIDYPLAIFANVGWTSENPATFDFLRDHLTPWADAHGVEIVWVSATDPDGNPEGILERMDRRPKGVLIPARAPNGAPGTRACTRDFKVYPVRDELVRRGATKDDPASVALGISVDEFHRMKDSPIRTQTHVFPLIDRRMDRDQCAALIASVGLPVPPKSSCEYCPFTKVREWADRRRNDPDSFERAAVVEDTISRRRTERGLYPLYLSSRAKPLREAFPIFSDPVQDALDDATCDVAGYCHA